MFLNSFHIISNRGNLEGGIFVEQVHLLFAHCDAMPYDRYFVDNLLPSIFLFRHAIPSD